MKLTVSIRSNPTLSNTNSTSMSQRNSAFVAGSVAHDFFHRGAEAVQSTQCRNTIVNRSSSDGGMFHSDQNDCDQPV